MWVWTYRSTTGNESTKLTIRSFEIKLSFKPNRLTKFKTQFFENKINVQNYKISYLSYPYDKQI